MKKILVILSFIPILLFSQSRLGCNFNEIQKEFSKYKTETKTFNNVKVLYVVGDILVIVYTFDESMICRNTMVITENENLVNYVIKQLNKLCYIVEPEKKWRQYNINNNNSMVTLTIQNDGTYIFTWL